MKFHSIIIFSGLLGLIQGCKNDATQATPPGPEWIAYTSSNSGLKNDHIRCLTIDASGTIWFGTDSGVTHFNPRSGTWTSYGIPLIPYPVISAAQAKDVSMWFGTLGGGIARYNPSSAGSPWSYFSDPSKVPPVPAGIASDKSNQTIYGEIWVASSTGIDRFTQRDPDALCLGGQ